MAHEYTKGQLLKMLSKKDVDLEKRDAKIAKLEDIVSYVLDNISDCKDITSLLSENFI